MTTAEKWDDVAHRHEEKAKMLDKYELSKEAKEHCEREKLQRDWRGRNDAERRILKVP